MLEAACPAGDIGDKRLEQWLGHRGSARMAGAVKHFDHAALRLAENAP